MKKEIVKALIYIWGFVVGAFAMKIVNDAYPKREA